MAKDSKEKKKEAIVGVMNQARSMELQAIHQYMNQHYNLDNMDYGDLAAKVKLIAIDEMRHAEMFADRIKELGGEPTARPGRERWKRGRRSKPFSLLMPIWKTIPSIGITSFSSSAGKTATASA